MWETWVWSLGWEDPLEKGKTTNSSILAWRIPWTVYSMEVAKNQTQLSDFHFTSAVMFLVIRSASIIHYLDNLKILWSNCLPTPQFVT